MSDLYVVVYRMRGTGRTWLPCPSLHKQKATAENFIREKRANGTYSDYEYRLARLEILPEREQTPEARP